MAPVPLALAVAWAGLQLGLSAVETAAAGIAALTAGFAAMRASGVKRDPEHRFAPAAYEAVDEELGELLLEAKDEVLILDDPLVEAAPDSRVVKLFARQDPTPGELVERISDFLSDGRPDQGPRQIPDAGAPADASTALHAALANIRASLR